MPDRPSDVILIRNTMAIGANRMAHFKTAIFNAVEFAKQRAPQLMVHVYIDEERGLCYSFQLFENSDAILKHWQVSDPNITEVMKHCVVRSMEVYGNPSQAVRDG